MLGQRFAERMGSLTTATLSCFDRVILTGDLPFHGNQYVNSWVDQELKIRRKDFLPLMKPLSDQLVANAKALAEQAGAEFVIVQGKRRKEDLVNRLATERRNPDGLIAVLQTQETGSTLKLCHEVGRPVLRYTRRPMRVLYVYFNDPDFGRMFVRIQTWFPFVTQVYVNGQEWLGRQMRQKKLGFVQRDNAFTHLDDPAAAQTLADQFAKLAWVRRLNRWIKPLNPLLKHAGLKGREDDWVIDQAEYSTDVLFADRSVSTAVGSRRGQRLGSGHPHVPEPQTAPPLRRRGAF